MSRPSSCVPSSLSVLLAVSDPAQLARSQPHLPSSKPPASWQPSSLSSAKLSLADPASPTKTLAAVREGQHRLVGDFDAHLEDVTVDWLRNARISV